MLRTWAEISLDSLRHNFQAVRDRVGPDVAIMAVVKADAYGHGAADVARTLAAAGAADGATWMGVATVAEGVALRAGGITQPILVLSGFLPGDEAALAECALTPVVYDAAQVDTLEALKIPYHVKVDTGMGRLGFQREALDAVIPRLGPMFDGLLTHFASADQDVPQNDAQLAQFAAITARLHPRWIHAANSAALARRTDCWGNLVRPGLALYGYLDGASLPLTPVLSLKTRLLSVKEFPAGSPLGYRGSYVTTRETRVAVAGAGYADGVNRALSNKGHAILHGQRVPILGRVNMDMTLLDVTSLSQAAPGDVATFIGPEIPATEMAALAGTSPYEILCHVGKRVPRVYL